MVHVLYGYLKNLKKKTWYFKTQYHQIFILKSFNKM